MNPHGILGNIFIVEGVDESLPKNAKRNQRVAETTLKNSETLFEQGFATELEVEGSRYAMEEAKLELSVQQTRLDVLERLTKSKELDTLKADLIATKARLEGRKAGLELEQGRLDLAKEPLGADCGGELGLHHLDGDLALVLQVGCQIDRGHPAGAELTLDAVAALKGGVQARYGVHPTRPR